MENNPGAGGNIGAEFVARQPADGYTLLMASTTQVVNLSFLAKLPNHPIRDFEPVSSLIQPVFMSNPTGPALKS